MKNKIKLLYVDDEEMNLELFTIHFEECFDVVTAESGEEGMETLSNHPDVKLVISDMKMPGMSGLEFITKATKIKKNIPYFIFSGYDLSDDILEAINKGLLTGYFQKPLNQVEMISKIKDSI